MSETTFAFELRRWAGGVDEWEVGEEHPLFVMEDRFAARSKVDDARIEVIWEGQCIAIAEARWVVLSWADSGGSGDHDHYVALRLVERREHPIWDELPWRDLPLLHVFYAWSHYMDGFSRPRESAQAIEKEGLWKDLESAWESGEHFSWHG